MTPAQIMTLAITPALSLLPPEMDSPEARRMLVAIAHQESDLQHRRQVGGPALGFWQFERMGGTYGVLRHPASRDHARNVADVLRYEPDLMSLHTAIENNDVLAAVCARLLLWTLPQPLPRHEQEGWSQYMQAWRPGRPHPPRWPAAWAAGQEVIG